MSDPISQLGLACPSGGDFYICQGNSTQFLGCCASDPCEDGKGTCPQNDLRTSSFDNSSYNDIFPQNCASSAGEWYTCSTLDTPFLGCCSTNACEDGCSTKDLVAAELSDSKASAAIFKTATATATATATTSSKSSVESATATSTASSTSDSSPTASSTAAMETAGTHSDSFRSSGLSTGAKAGIAIGASIGVIALLVAIFVVGRRYLRKRRGVVVTGSPPRAMMNMSNPVSSYGYHGQFRVLLSSCCVPSYPPKRHHDMSPRTSR